MRKKESLIRLSAAMAFLPIHGNGYLHHLDYTVWQETNRIYDSMAQQTGGKDEMKNE